MKFNYLARDKDGQIQKGIIEASSEETALAMLQNSGFFITHLEKEKIAPIYAKELKLFSSISKKDLVLFSRQMAIMFKSQVPIVEALDAIVKQSEKPELKEKISKISAEVEGGARLSAALGLFPKLFSTFFISMIISGEASGKLSEALEYLADHLEYDYNFQSKIRGAMIYPVFVVFIFIAVVILLVYWVLPPLMEILTESGRALPWSTNIILIFSNFIRERALLIVLVLAGIVGVAVRYFRSPEGKEVLDKNMLKVPVLGPLLRKIYLSRFSENLGTLISGGLPIAKALEISAEVVGNKSYKDIILATRDGVRRGESISVILQNYPKEIPPLFVQMAVVGEKTGRMESAFSNIVGFYQKEVDRGISTAIALIEPFMLVVMGVGVAFLMVSILLPIYQIGNF
jgi:type II secretory pathway component PulF